MFTRVRTCVFVFVLVPNYNGRRKQEERERDIIERQTDRQTDRQTYKCIHRLTEREKGMKRHKQTDGD